MGKMCVDTLCPTNGSAVLFCKIYFVFCFFGTIALLTCTFVYSNWGLLGSLGGLWGPLGGMIYSYGWYKGKNPEDKREDFPCCGEGGSSNKV